MPLLKRGTHAPTTPVLAISLLLSTTSQNSPTNSIPYSPLPTIPLYSPTASTASVECLLKWCETLAMILANHAPRDNQAITGLGDILQHMFGKKNLIGL